MRLFRSRIYEAETGTMYFDRHLTGKIIIDDVVKSSVYSRISGYYICMRSWDENYRDIVTLFYN